LTGNFCYNGGSHPFRWGRNGHEGIATEGAKSAQSTLRRARQWYRPPHWDGNEWQKELDAIARAAAFKACCCFDEQQSVPLEAIVFQQVLIALRDFHRHDWAYFAVHYRHLSRVSDEGEAAVRI
jgi:hypothetical protein